MSVRAWNGRRWLVCAAAARRLGYGRTLISVRAWNRRRGLGRRGASIERRRVKGMYRSGMACRI